MTASDRQVQPTWQMVAAALLAANEVSIELCAHVCPVCGGCLDTCCTCNGDDDDNE